MIYLIGAVPFNKHCCKFPVFHKYFTSIFHLYPSGPTVCVCVCVCVCERERERERESQYRIWIQYQSEYTKNVFKNKEERRIYLLTGVETFRDLPKRSLNHGLWTVWILVRWELERKESAWGANWIRWGGVDAQTLIENSAFFTSFPGGLTPIHTLIHVIRLTFTWCRQSQPRV